MPSVTPGSCLCGDVRFEITGEFERFFLCHCQRCRKVTGSAYAANLFSKTANVRWLSGKPLIKTYQLTDTHHCKSFCSVCSAALPCEVDGRGLKVPAGCLEGPIKIRPQAHIFMASKAHWDQGLEGVRRYDEAAY